MREERERNPKKKPNQLIYSDSFYKHKRSSDEESEEVLEIVDEIPPQIIDLENNISEYEETPIKKHDSLIKTFQESIVKSMMRSPSKKDDGIEISIELNGQTYSRNFSSPEFGVKALEEIDEILKANE